MSASRTLLIGCLALLLKGQAQVLSRVELGVVLRPVTPVYLQTNTWLHMLVIPLPRRDPPMVPARGCRLEDVGFSKYTRKTVEYWCSVLGQIETVGRFYNYTLMTEVRRTIHTIQTMIADAAGGQRRKQQAMEQAKGEDTISKRSVDNLKELYIPYSVSYTRGLISDLEWLRRSLLVNLTETIKDVQPEEFRESARSRAQTRTRPRARSRARPRRSFWDDLLAGAAGLTPIGQSVYNIYSRRQTEDRLSHLERLIEELHADDATIMKDYTTKISGVVNITRRYMNLTDTRFQRVSELLQKISERMDNLRTFLKEKLIVFNRLIIYTHYILLAYVQTIQGLQQYLVYLYQISLGVQAAIRGKLTSHLLPFEEMVKAVQIMKEHMMKDIPGYQIGVDDVGDLYHLPLHAVYAMSETLYVTMAVPITYTDNIYEVYQIQTFPVPAGAGDHETYTQIVGVPDYIAVCDGYYVEMNVDDYSQCIGDNSIKVCLSRFPEKDFSQVTCALALYQHKLIYVTSHCDAKLMINQSFLDIIIPLADDTLYVASVAGDKTWTISCAGERPKTEPTCFTCEIMLPCFCSLRTTNSFFPAPLSYCQKYSSQQEILVPAYVKNLMYITQVVENGTFEIDRGMYVDTQEDALGPPLTPEYVRTLLDDDDFQSERKRLEVDIRHMSHEVSQDRLEWYLNKLQAGKTLKATITSSHKRSLIAMFIGITVVIVTILCIVALIILCRRMGGISTMVGLLTKAPGVRATPLEGCHTLFGIMPFYVESLFFGVVIIMCCIHIFKQGMKLYLRRHAVYRPSLFFPWAAGSGRTTSVLLELGTTAEYIILDLQKLVGPPLRYRLRHSTPNLEGLPIVRYCVNPCRHKIKIDWKTTQLYDEITEQDVPLQTVVSVPYVARTAAKRIIEQEMSLRILVGSQGVYEGFPIFLSNADSEARPIGASERPRSIWTLRSF